ncbi:hypothetical protein [Streptomyces sp. KL116D]|uniref:hypothetical protein n=1 Tax=Streptomyces sp. KL116D TaxID=3045152 RepID=UPI0035570293
MTVPTEPPDFFETRRTGTVPGRRLRLGPRDDADPTRKVVWAELALGDVDAGGCD